MNQPLVPSDQLETVARHFKLLGAPVRLELLNVIATEGEMSVGDVVEATGHRQANVSKHLGLLAEGGLLSRRRDGVHVYYALDDPTLAALCMLVRAQMQGDLESSSSE